MNAGSSDETRAADRWLLGLGVALWIVAVITLVVFHLGVETVLSRDEAFLRDLPPESRSQPVFQAMPAFHSQLRLARSLPALAVLAVLVAIVLIRRFRTGPSGATLAAGSGLVVAASTVAALLWAMVVATAPG